VSMDFWLAVVIIVVVGSVMETVRQYLKRSDRGSSAADKRIAELEAAGRKLEQRLGNLETIILELEKEKSYSS
jgi:membrane protein required for beta-lactamase induction